ncbi:MAG: DUF3667 domain-containing protein [Ignavibacteriae bacterium]|nr:DUF3667 domain-containing protein [Ignavibacteriota bacterium]MCB9244459.1 DUF3667 domain-containing protein [Ignavibacteriales bacterium]
MHVCTNCGFKYEGKYCPECGVRKNNGRIYFHDQLHDIMYYLFSLDSPLPATFKGLLTNPGRVGREYIGGKRKKYYPPIKYFILCSAIYFLLVKITGIDPFEESTTETIRHYGNYFVFLLVPILALFSKIFFFKQHNNYSEYIAYSFLLVAQYLLVTLLYIPLYSFFNIILANTFFLIYLIWGVFSFHGGNPWLKLLLSLLTVIASEALFIILVSNIANLFLKSH